jgi:RyR domain
MQTQDLIDVIAQAVHEFNRAYCRGINQDSAPANLRYEDTPVGMRDVLRKVVLAALNGSSAAESHDTWVKNKKAQGWMYGPVQSATLMTHPCMMAYEDLPEEQRRKDENLIHVVRGMAYALGMEYRIPDIDGGVVRIMQPDRTIRIKAL